MTDKHCNWHANVLVPIHMLHHIYSDSLAHLLTSVLSKSHFTPVFLSSHSSHLTLAFTASVLGLTHIRALDAHLFSTAKNSSSLSSLNHGDVIEIQGAPSSGKTHLLYHLLINCITPSGHHSINLGGWDKAAVVFDMDHSFDIVRFNRLLQGRLTRLMGGSASAIEAIAQRSLEKLRIFRPCSSSQLAVTISHLAEYQSTHLPNEEIGIVAIDSMSAHYWPDRFFAEQIRTAAASPEHPRNVDIPPLQHVLLALESFRRSHGPVILLTNWGLHLVSNSNPILYRQHLHPFPAPFPHSHPPTPHHDVNATIPQENLLRLTCHITLHQDMSRASGAVSKEVSWDMEESAIVGLVRTPNHPTVHKFLLSITGDDILTN
ncbi:hypothetical protein D9615_005308 [Tricholomella constricta]|uniref:DNA recombination and repair protein Rad51-like C-terminal domain-containing protein n=1 Tax=Tricholomella constricta TaxID=117010 RepID=A0A8H5H6E6_9AGAR|nr:hypothetical protein D9615_005308 [Tricholomella constricta]